MSVDIPVVTERPNSLTEELDVVGPVGIVRLLRQSDAQVFAGWGPYVGLYDQATQNTLISIVNSVQSWFSASHDASKRVKVIMAGAGTSGRLSFFCARSLNRVAKSLGSNVEFDYLMAGNDLALMKSQEAAEDDVMQSVENLKTRTAGYSHVIYIGITCGLSAPYVGSQLDYIMNTPEAVRNLLLNFTLCMRHILTSGNIFYYNQDSKFVSILMGFNDISVARKVKIEKWNKTMFDVVSQLASRVGSGRHFILNPIVGPEPLTGSSRMKGGTVTKLLIEVLFAFIFHKCFPDTALALPERKHPNSKFDLPSMFMEFERTNRHTYLQEQSVAAMVQHAGDALKSNSHVYYFAEDSVGILGLIDASECPPTFGADFTDIRGFVVGGWETMQNLEGDMTKKTSDPHYRIGAEDFVAESACQLTSSDLLIFLHPEGQRTDRLLELAKQCAKNSKNDSLQFVLITWHRRTSSDLSHPVEIDELTQALASLSKTPVKTCNIAIPNLQLLSGLPSLVEMSVKWVLNTISLGAHVLRGKVFRNRMIDLTLSNNKLYHRGCAMVSDILKISLEEATTALLRAIFQVDIVTNEIRETPVSKYNEIAVKRKQVIPLAILLGCGKYATVADAQEALNTEPVVRNLVQRILFGK